MLENRNNSNFLTSPLPSKKVLPPILRDSQMSHITASIDTSSEAFSQPVVQPGQEVSPDGIGAVEYYERREHTKLHEKLDFIVNQIGRLDRNVKCLALTDGANLALQTMMDASQLSDFEKLRRNTMPPRSESKVLLKLQGSKQAFLIPVEREGYQLVIMNNLHEITVYKDYFGMQTSTETSQSEETKEAA